VKSETFRFQVGEFSCIALRDHAFRYPLPMFLTNLTKEQYQPWLRQRGEDLEEVELPYISLLIHTGRQKVLVDTGIGTDAAGPVPGKLLHLLRAEGIEPREIDTVILSHAHSDHVGGILDEAGKPAFPRARHVMFQKEWDYWMANPGLSELPVDESFKQKLLASVRKNLPPIQGQLDLLREETEVLPGITAKAAFGHSPGHMALEVSSAGEQLLFVADALILPLNLEFPEVRGVTDHQPEQMVSTRRRLLNQAAQGKAMVSTSHFPFPGLGHVAPKGDVWDWRPISASSDAHG
jgi:glyoxylase-like metal-dependent hydrolase (beta-lactamase superfamily II)